jgi:hypothetical protein
MGMLHRRWDRMSVAMRLGAALTTTMHTRERLAVLALSLPAPIAAVWFVYPLSPRGPDGLSFSPHEKARPAGLRCRGAYGFGQSC